MFKYVYRFLFLREILLSSTHSEVHEAQELLQHFCHDGKIAFR